MYGIEEWILKVRTCFLDEIAIVFNEDTEYVLTLDFDEVQFADFDLVYYCIEKIKIKYFWKNCCCDYSMKKASK